MENVGREPRIPRSWMETDEDFAMECGRPHRPTPPRRPHCAGWSDEDVYKRQEGIRSDGNDFVSVFLAV